MCLFEKRNFDQVDKQRGDRGEKAKDHQFRARSKKDDTQSQRLLAEQLNSNEPVIALRSRAMEKFQTIEKWVPRKN